jgi:hypothetical protein
MMTVSSAEQLFDIADNMGTVLRTVEHALIRLARPPVPGAQATIPARFL